MHDAPNVSPIPPRYWWLKRLAIAIPLMLLAALTLRLIWGHRANQRLEATINAIAARGEPIRFEDMVIDPVPDQDNKAYYLEQALANWPTVPGQNVRITDTDWYSGDGFSYSGPFGFAPTQGTPIPDPITDNRAYLDQCQSAIDMLRKAEQAPHVDWHVQVVQPAVQILLPSLGRHRELARLADDGIQRAHELGDDPLALDLMRLILASASAANGKPDTVIGHLVYISINAMMLGSLEKLGPAIAWDKETTQHKTHALILELLDESELKASFTRSGIGERWMAYDLCLDIMESPYSQLSSGNPNPAMDRLYRTLFLPILKADTQLVANYNTAFVEAAKMHPDSAWDFEQEVATHVPVDFDQIITSTPQLHPLSAILASANDATCRTHFQHLAYRRLAATALAIHLYEADHGRRPATLDELVPDYLPAVPLDPFAKDGGMIRYKCDGAILISNDQQWPAENGREVTPLPDAGPAIVYSVGPSSIDHGGRVFLEEDGTYMDHERYRDYADIYFLLDPTPQPRPIKSDESDDVDDGLDPQPDGGFIYP